MLTDFHSNDPSELLTYGFAIDASTVIRQYRPCIIIVIIIIVVLEA